MSERPAEVVLWDFLRGALMTKALGLAADLEIAQTLADGPRAVEDLAREAAVEPDVLHRVLRALASDGVDRGAQCPQDDRHVGCRQREFTLHHGHPQLEAVIVDPTQVLDIHEAIADLHRRVAVDGQEVDLVADVIRLHVVARQELLGSVERLTERAPLPPRHDPRRCGPRRLAHGVLIAPRSDRARA